MPCSPGSVQIAPPVNLSVGARTFPTVPRAWIAFTTRKSASGCQDLSYCPGRAWIAAPTRISVSGCRDLPHCLGSMQIALATRKYISWYQDLPALPQEGTDNSPTRKPPRGRAENTAEPQGPCNKERKDEISPHGCTVWSYGCTRVTSPLMVS